MDLEEGEVICSKCKGKGLILHNDIKKMDYNCGKCNGTGKTDWITNAMSRDFSYIEPGAMMNPCAEVELYYEGIRTIKTTTDGFKIWGQKKMKGA